MLSLRSAGSLPDLCWVVAVVRLSWDTHTESATLQVSHLRRSHHKETYRLVILMDIVDKVQPFGQAQLSRQLRGLCHYLDNEDLEDRGDDGEDETDEPFDQQTCHLACPHICE